MKGTALLHALEELLGDELDVRQLLGPACAHRCRAVVRYGGQHARILCIIEVSLEGRVRLLSDVPGRHVHKLRAHYDRHLSGINTYSAVLVYSLTAQKRLCTFKDEAHKLSAQEVDAID